MSSKPPFALPLHFPETAVNRIIGAVRRTIGQDKQSALHARIDMAADRIIGAHLMDQVNSGGRTYSRRTKDLKVVGSMAKDLLSKLGFSARNVAALSSIGSSTTHCIGDPCLHADLHRAALFISRGLTEPPDPPVIHYTSVKEVMADDRRTEQTLNGIYEALAQTVLLAQMAEEMVGRFVGRSGSHRHQARLAPQYLIAEATTIGSSFFGLKVGSSTNTKGQAGGPLIRLVMALRDEVVELVRQEQPDYGDELAIAMKISPGAIRDRIREMKHSKKSNFSAT
jgi:hypothetical protein